jgi:hypothetical protein
VADVFRLQILKALTASLEATDLTDFGVYASDGVTLLTSMVGRVFRGRIAFGDDDPLPMLSVLEVPIPLDQIVSPEDSSYSAGTWELLIQGFAVEDAIHPTDPAHVLMAAVKKRLAYEKRRNRSFQILGFKALRDMRIGAGVVRPPDEISSRAYFWLNLSLDITEDLLEPFDGGPA